MGIDLAYKKLIKKYWTMVQFLTTDIPAIKQLITTVQTAQKMLQGKSWVYN